MNNYPICPKCGTMLDYYFEDTYYCNDNFYSERLGYCHKCGKDTKYTWIQEYIPKGFSNLEIIDEETTTEKDFDISIY